MECQSLGLKTYRFSPSIGFESHFNPGWRRWYHFVSTKTEYKIYFVFHNFDILCCRWQGSFVVGTILLTKAVRKTVLVPCAPHSMQSKHFFNFLSLEILWLISVILSSHWLNDMLSDSYTRSQDCEYIGDLGVLRMSLIMQVRGLHGKFSQTSYQARDKRR